MRRASILLLIALPMLLAIIPGCGKDPAQMSDAELGLNQEQARGRRVFNVYCANCHPAYSSRGNKGPGLKGLFKKPYFPSGLTATDEHAIQSVVQGRGMMPGNPEITREQAQELVAYLHTL